MSGVGVGVWGEGLWYYNVSLPLQLRKIDEMLVPTVGRCTHHLDTTECLEYNKYRIYPCQAGYKTRYIPWDFALGTSSASLKH